MADKACPTTATWLQGKSSKSFRDELGFVGSEEIIHRNNICLLSIIQSTDPDPPQDGTPILPTEDEPTPTRGGPSYQPHQDFNMGSSETNIPGLSQPSWGMQPQQQQQPPPQTGYQYPAGSVPMQTSQGYAGYGADSSQMYQQHYQSQGAPAYAGNTATGCCRCFHCENLQVHCNRYIWHHQ